MHHPREGSSFTLVELLISMAVLTLVALMMVSIVNSISSIWRSTTSEIQQFRAARTAFEAMTRRISQATLNTYWDYQYPNNNNTLAPTSYFRQSDLRFIALSGSQTLPSGITTPPRPTHAIFFQAPLGFVDSTGTNNFGGLDNLLNTWGYYVEFNWDKPGRPGFIGPNIAPYKYRYRLMELSQSSNSLEIYQWTSGNSAYNGHNWFTDPVNALASDGFTPICSHVIAANVIAAVFLPMLSPNDEQALIASGTSGLTGPAGTNLCPAYSYDSTVTGTNNLINPKNQLPPVVQVTLVAIDEASAIRIANGSTPPSFDSLLASLFKDSTKFTADLATLQASLINSHINFRVFTTNVSIRGAKWSRY